MKRIFFLLFAMVFVVASCEPDDSSDSDSESSDTPWERQFLFGNTIINGQPVLTSEQSTTNGNIIDIVCYDALPDGNFQNFSIEIFVPSHIDPDYQSGMIEREWIIFFGELITEDIYTSGSLQFLGKEDINGVTYSAFRMNGSYNGNEPINKDNFRQMRVDFDIAYKDDNDEQYYSAPRAISINIDACL